MIDVLILYSENRIKKEILDKTANKIGIPIAKIYNSKIHLSLPRKEREEEIKGLIKKIKEGIKEKEEYIKEFEIGKERKKIGIIYHYGNNMRSLILWKRGKPITYFTEESILSETIKKIIEEEFKVY